MSVDPERLRRLLGRDEVQWVVRRARQRLERGMPLRGRVVLSDASSAQRRAVEDLLGRPTGSGAAVSVSLDELERVLARSGVAPDLGTAIEELGGPVCNRTDAQAALERAWSSAFAPLEGMVRSNPILAPWLDWVRATGLLRRVAHADPGLAREYALKAAQLVERLPANPVPVSVLANDVAGDAHALDAGRPLCALVIRAVARLGGIPEADGAEWRRTVWASVGVLSGELTAPVLCLNVPGDSTSAAGRALRLWREVGQPVHLTARQLLRDPPTFDALHGRTVYVCENPTVIAEAANSLGSACAPLVCASGHPAAAATLLLRSLVASGARLRYHGDFDWPGVTIGTGIFTRFDAAPWRFDRSAYLRAASSGGPKLHGRPISTPWDPQLSVEMHAIAVKVEEERVLPELLCDLGD